MTLDDRFLVIGATGLLGSRMLAYLKSAGYISMGTYNSNKSSNTYMHFCDCTDLQQVSQLIKNHKINIVINCSGLTNVEYCQNNPKQADEINTTASKNIAIACRQNEVKKLIHFSTDMLFSGAKSFSTENDVTNPLNVYAKTKLKGEVEALENFSETLVFRTNFFGFALGQKKSFSDVIIDNCRSRECSYLFSDVYFNPVSISFLIENTMKLISLDISGIVNISSDDRISKADFGRIIQEKLNLDGTICESLFTERRDLVVRPLDMTLSNARLKGLLKMKRISIFDQMDELI